MELPDRVYEQIQNLCAEGDKLMEDEQYGKALKKYMEALDLLPKPKIDWKACTWILAAIGDVHFLTRNYSQARQAMTDALRCPGGLGNPFIHLRLGEALFELGEKDAAADHLTRAYMGAGTDIFDTEAPKYFAFLKTKIKPPVNGHW